MIDDRGEYPDRGVAVARDDVDHLLPDDAFAIIEFVGIADCEGDDMRGVRQIDQQEEEKETDRKARRPTPDGQTRTGRATSIICLPRGLNGHLRYAPINIMDTGSRDFIVSGRKRGRTSITSQPCARRKSPRLMWL